MNSAVSNRRTDWLLAVLMVTTIPVLAQNQPSSPATWTLMLHVDPPVGGPNAQIKTFMQSHGLYGSSTGFFGTDTYPIGRAGPSLGLRMELFRKNRSIAGDFHFISGRVDGSRDVVVRWQAISLAPLYSFYSSNPSRRISIGPSLQWIQTQAGTNFFRSTGLRLLPSVGLAKQTNVVPGLVIDAALRFPARSLFFAELGARYEAAFGRVHNQIRFNTGAALPIDVKFNRFLFTIGVGCRFGGSWR